ncbi:MAG TPA: hypothetical protein VHS56_09905 [Candidatus Cybelea sp.]|nr:hypothetical protein [Candidatus Cybelea sp.]
MAVLIVEGVTGSGKSSTVRALQSCASFKLYDEHRTFDDFLTQFWDDPREAARRALRRYEAILTEIEQHPGQDYLLERFHFSPIAVGSDPAWYQTINERCAALGCKTAVLTIPQDQLLCRSLNRKEYGARDWQSLIARYGSEKGSLSVLYAAQRRRLEAVERSGLPFILVDTNAMTWDDYAVEIARWSGWSA